MNRLLITGGAGFIGANFTQYWLANHPKDHVVVLDALTYAGSKTNLTPVEVLPNYQFAHADLSDTCYLQNLLEQENINIIVHFAAESHVDRSISDPDIFISSNIVGTHNLLKAARGAWNNTKLQNCHFHHVSTDEVYGSLELTDPAFTENTPYAPNSPYSASKASSDHIVRAYHHTYNLPVTISNCSNNYGAYQHPEKFIPTIITNILEGKEIPVYGDGKNIRDWLHVAEHCRGIELILNKGKNGEIYNIGSDNEKTNLEIVDTVCSLLDQKLSTPKLCELFPDSPRASGGESKNLLKFVTDRAGHDRRYAIDSTKMREELGHHPKGDFLDNMDKTIQWYIDNRVWWKALKKETATS